MFEQTESLDEIWEYVQEQDDKKDQNMKNMVKSTGGGFLHELMHIDLISGPRGHSKSFLRLILVPLPSFVQELYD